MNRGLITLAIWSILLSCPASAESVVLKCSDASGSWADFGFDLGKRIGWFGHTSNQFQLALETDRYLTFVQINKTSQPPVGGQIWVMDRVSGEVKRTLSGLFCAKSDCESGNNYFDAYAMVGKCSKPQF